MFFKKFFGKKEEEKTKEEEKKEEVTKPTYCGTNHNDYLYKILLVGDCGVGKSSIISRYVYDTFTDSYATTIGVDYKIKTIKTNDGKSVKLQIWDVAFADRSPTPSSYCRGAQAVLICFDITNIESFENVKNKWKNEIERYACEGMSIVIVGTKCDLPPVVDLDAVREYAGSINVPFMLCSAKTGEGLNEVFEMTVNHIIERLEKK